jgi:hypothetical protein
MADKKISALTGATTPLAGTEVLPIVQSGATVKVAVSDLTAGRAISATQLTLSTGNLIVANGQGIDFSATPGTGTSELLNDYEEGTWTPASGVGTATSVSGTYTKVGRQVTVIGTITFPVQTNAAVATIVSLPFTPAGTGSGGVVQYTDFGATLFLYGAAAGIQLFTTAGAGISYTVFSGKRLDFVMTYFV